MKNRWKSFICFLIVLAVVEADAREKQTIAQVRYYGGDYYTDPSALPNLAAFASEQTGVDWEAAEGAVSLVDPNLGLYPVLYLTGHGDIRLQADEERALRNYLERGGFLIVNDNGPERSGNSIDRGFRREIEKVLPAKPLVELPKDHPIYRSFHEFPDGLPQIHRHDENEPPRGFGIYLNGRLAVFYSWNSDIGNGWENPEVHNDPPEKRLEALRMGTNLLMHAILQ